MTKPSLSTVEIGWCRDPARAEAIARFFADHADPSYISHSELQFGRAAALGRWSDDLLTRVATEARRALSNAPAEDGTIAGPRCALAAQDGALLGMAFVSFSPHAPTPFATLEDLLLDPAARGAGVGNAVLDWVAAEARAAGFRRLFLESGLTNHRAHHFFETRGFHQTSIVMMRDL